MLLRGQSIWALSMLPFTDFSVLFLFLPSLLSQSFHVYSHQKSWFEYSLWSQPSLLHLTYPTIHIVSAQIFWSITLHNSYLHNLLQKFSPAPFTFSFTFEMYLTSTTNSSPPSYHHLFPGLQQCHTHSLALTVVPDQSMAKLILLKSSSILSSLLLQA